MRIQNDLLEGVDRDGGAILVSLDVCVDFDTVDHERLVQVLYNLWIRGLALELSKSYLEERTYVVRTPEVVTGKFALKYGIPQGYVLGPVLFSLYAISLGEIFRDHGLYYHSYADDNEFYLSFRPLDPASAKDIMQILKVTATNINTRMESHFLKMNPQKTRILVVLPLSSGKAVDISSLNIGLDGTPLTPCCTMKNLGILWDHSLSMEGQVNSICKRGFYHLHNLPKILKYLDTDATRTLVATLVTPQLNYCSGLLIGPSKGAVKNLQRVQQSSARIIARQGKYDHIAPVLHELYIDCL